MAHSRRAGRGIALGSIVVLVVSAMLPLNVLGRGPTGTDRFEPTPIKGTVDAQLLPRSANDSRNVTVMLEMRGDPVAVVQSRDADKSLSKARSNRIKADLRARQDAIKPQIAANGGRVISQLQSAYNGMKVTVARSNVAALAALPNVIAIRAIQQHTRGNETSVPFLGVPTQAWQNLGVTGLGMKIAVIDTGIDYTHANFGGPGTEEAYEAADAADTTLGPEDAPWFGPSAPKVKGGTDLVGDAYTGDNAPVPDPDPLDCPFFNGSVGHGSHVSGTATGFGVLANGETYAGPYDSTTHSNNFEIGPGVAPEADLYFVRVFGCDGSTNVTTEAIDWAVDHDMDVINMSLGSPFGRDDDPSAVASTNAAAAGVTVVTSAGNSGPSVYITGSPGTGDGSIATAAMDSNQTFPAVILDLTPGAEINTIAANGIQPPNGTSYNVVVLTDDAATTDENEALGCSVEAYEKAGITEGANQLAVTERGVCARVARGVYGQQAGAAAVAMINNAASFPPFEGPILSNPDLGVPFEVTIPFLGVFGPQNSADANALRAATTVSTTATTLNNPGFRGFASFTSGGPRNGDSALKPDITAPGVSTLSTASGTGNKGYVLSGTSMASPHVAGVAALVRQAHPDWTPEDVKAAIVNTGNPAGFAGAGATYRVTRAGSGLVTPAAAIATDVVALGDVIPANPGLGLAQFQTSNLSFGFAELGANFSGTREITIRNHGTSSVELTPAQAIGPASAPHTLAFGTSSLIVPAGETRTLSVTLNVTASTAGNSAAFRHVSGNVLLTGGEVPLRVPYLLVPRPLSKVSGALSGNLNPNGVPRTFTVTNPGGQIPGAADVYQWGLQDGNDVNEAIFGGGGYDMRAVGVQAFEENADEQLIVFAVSTHDRWSNAAVNEYDILVNVDGDAAAEYAVVGLDFGAVTAGSFDGRLGAFVFNLETDVATIEFFAAAPSDSSTLLLPILSSQLGLTEADGNFEYQAVSFSLEGPGQDPMKGKAGFNPWTPAITNFPFLPVAPGGSNSDSIAIDPVAFDSQKMLGVMSVVHDNASGAAEAQLLKAPGNP
jgi:subtilisin family serine protease